MDAEQWRLARPILESALQRPAGERRSYVDAVCPDYSLRARILSLLAAHDEAGYLENSAAQNYDPWPGRRLGAWLLVRRIGQGGMGAVYEGLRVDGEYQMRAAVKLANATAWSPESAKRFLNERQVLAGLDHPGIARMLDGGTTAEGTPYLVMEYIEGVSIDRFCGERRLGIRERLELFRAVCASVEYAHHHLVIHRDIKPDNILVTPGGAPKLLDFGIAKLMTADAAELTRTAQRPMTPAYASPEQITGGHITTATDVYALGVLLYALLAGAHPFRGYAGPDLERAILEGEPAPPSALPGLDESVRKVMRGDLDAIVWTAMRKAPSQRYASVESLSADIARHLAGHPVTARPNTSAYRAARFVHRHRTGLAVGIAVLSGLLTATGVSFSFARQARAGRELADTRFREVRNLAGFFLFEFDDDIRAGPTAARRGVVEKGLAYLDQLAKDQADSGLIREVIRGYCRVGDLQGNMFYENLGDVAGANASYARALELQRGLEQTEPASVETRVTRALLEQKLGEAAVQRGARPEALEHFRVAAALLGATEPTVATRRALAEIHSRAGMTHYQNGHFSAARDEYEQARRLAEPLQAALPQNLQIQVLSLTSRQRAGELLARTGNLSAGIGSVRGALADFESLAREHPTDTSIARGVVVAHILLGSLLTESHDPQASLEFERASAAAERLVGVDPRNLQYRRDLSVAQSLLASALYRSDRKTEAHEIAARVLRNMKATADSDSATDYDLHEYCRVLVDTPFHDLRNPAEARRYAERVVQMTGGGNARILDILARALDQLGEARQASQTEEKALAMLSDPASLRRKDMEANLARFRAHEGGRRQQ
jgi:non-specific serine/threonine protein kinase/serine/threonine-protein kinase